MEGHHLPISNRATPHHQTLPHRQDHGGCRRRYVRNKSNFTSAAVRHGRKVTWSPWSVCTGVRDCFRTIGHRPWLPWDVESMTLHNCMWRWGISLVRRPTRFSVYYHIIILIFRPFLVAQHAIRVSGRSSESKDMWLRQACRYAVDAAQDSIEVSANSSQVCKVVEIVRSKSGHHIWPHRQQSSRYQGFFIECCCAVLLYNILCQPSKYSYNMEYIQKAMQTLSSMVADEPITSSLRSIHRVLNSVEASIFGHRHGTQSAPLNDVSSHRQYSFTHFPSLDQTEVIDPGRRILQTGETGTQGDRSHSLLRGLVDILSDQDWTNPSHFNFNVMTTDLFNYFPLDATTLT